MHPRIELLNELAAQGAALTVAVLWQSTVVALLVWMLTRVLWRSTPTVRYWLWQLVAIKLLVMPFWTWSLPQLWPGGSVAQSSSSAQRSAARELGNSVTVTPTPPPAGVDLPAAGAVRRASEAAARQQPAPQLTWQAWLLVAWAAVVLAQVGLLIAQRLRLRRFLAGTQVAGGELVDLVHGVARRIGLGRVPTVRLAAGECSPFVYGIVRSSLVLPGNLAAELGPEELQQVVAHELAHLQRRDLLWGWIPRMARVVYFFHPVAYWTEGQVRLERELACDQVALGVGDRRPVEYAETLVRVMGLKSQSGAWHACPAGDIDESG
jgi:beta-lactamase regulating signal transducer with metallopeptidase domain